MPPKLTHSSRKPKAEKLPPSNQSTHDEASANTAVELSLSEKLSNAIANQKATEEALSKLKDGANDSGRRTRSALEQITSLEASLKKYQEEEQSIGVAMSAGNASTTPTPVTDGPNDQEGPSDHIPNTAKSTLGGFDGRQQKQEAIEISIPPELFLSAADPFEIDIASSDLSSIPSSPSSIKSVQALVHSSAPLPLSPVDGNSLQSLAGAGAISPMETNSASDDSHVLAQPTAPELDGSNVIHTGAPSPPPVSGANHGPEPISEPGNMSERPITLSTDMEVDTDPLHSTHEAVPSWNKNDLKLLKRPASPSFSMQMDGINRDVDRDHPAYQFGPNKAEMFLPDHHDNRGLDVNMSPWGHTMEDASGNHQMYERNNYMEPHNDNLMNLNGGIPGFYPMGHISSYTDAYNGPFLVIDLEYPGSAMFQRDWVINALLVPDTSRAGILDLMDERDRSNMRLGEWHFLKENCQDDVVVSGLTSKIDSMSQSLRSVNDRLARAAHVVHQSFPPLHPPTNFEPHNTVSTLPAVPARELLTAQDMPSARNPPPAADYRDYATDSGDEASAPARPPVSSETAIQTLQKRMKYLQKLDTEMSGAMAKDVLQNKPDLSPQLFAKLRATREERNFLSAQIESLAGAVSKPAVERKIRKPRPGKAERPTQRVPPGAPQADLEPPIADPHPIAAPDEFEGLPKLLGPEPDDDDSDNDHPSPAPPVAISFRVDEPYLDPCILDPSLPGVTRKPGRYLMSLDTVGQMYPQTGCENEKYPFWGSEEQAEWDEKVNFQIRRYHETGEAMDGEVRRTIRHVDTVGPQAAQCSFALALHVHLNGSGNFVCRYHARTKSYKWFDGNLTLASVNNGCPFPGRLGTLGHPGIAQPKCMHCGCYIEEVLLEFYFFKTWTIVSHRPGYSDRMEGWGADYFPLRQRGMAVQAMAKHAGITIKNIYCGNPDGPTAGNIRDRLVSQIEHLISQLNSISPAITYSLNTKLTVTIGNLNTAPKPPAVPAPADDEMNHDSEGTADISVDDV